MSLADGHAIKVVVRERTYKAIDFSHPDRPRVDKVEHSQHVVCSCGWEDPIQTVWGGNIRESEALPLDDGRVEKLIARHRRVVEGERGCYECGCTVADQWNGRRRKRCATHRRPYRPLKPSSYKGPVMTAGEVLDHLGKHYVPNEWAFFTELRLAAGWESGRHSDDIKGEQRVDALAFNCWPSKGFRRIAFEVKVTRSDFLSEIKKPEKRASAMSVAHQFFFVTPEGLVTKDEIPEGCGLMEIALDGERLITLNAPKRDVDDPPMRFIASLLRSAARKAS